MQRAKKLAEGFSHAEKRFLLVRDEGLAYSGQLDITLAL